MFKPDGEISVNYACRMRQISVSQASIKREGSVETRLKKRQLSVTKAKVSVM
jgi:hypothetical protein